MCYMRTFNVRTSTWWTGVTTFARRRSRQGRSPLRRCGASSIGSAMARSNRCGLHGGKRHARPRCRSAIRWPSSRSPTAIVPAADWLCLQRWSTPPGRASRCNTARIADASCTTPRPWRGRPRRSRTANVPWKWASPVSAASLMVPKLAATTREEVVSELAQVLAAGEFIEDAATVTELALR